MRTAMLPIRPIAGHGSLLRRRFRPKRVGGLTRFPKVVNYLQVLTHVFLHREVTTYKNLFIKSQVHTVTQGYERLTSELLRNKRSSNGLPPNKIKTIITRSSMHACNICNVTNVTTFWSWALHCIQNPQSGQQRVLEVVEHSVY